MSSDPDNMAQVTGDFPDPPCAPRYTDEWDACTSFLCGLQSICDDSKSENAFFQGIVRLLDKSHRFSAVLWFRFSSRLECAEVLSATADWLTAVQQQQLTSLARVACQRQVAQQQGLGNTPGLRAVVVPKRAQGQVAEAWAVVLSGPRRQLQGR